MSDKAMVNLTKRQANIVAGVLKADLADGRVEGSDREAVIAALRRLRKAVDRRDQRAARVDRQ